MEAETKSNILVFLTAVLALIALWVSMVVLYWANVYAHGEKYQVATLHVQSIESSGAQRGLRGYWIVTGLIDGQSEKLAVPRNTKLAKQAPFAAGDLLPVCFRPDITDWFINGRSLRVILPSDLAAAKHNLVISAGEFFGLGTISTLLCLFRYFWYGRWKVNCLSSP